MTNHIRLLTYKRIFVHIRFFGCSALTSVVIPDSVTEIGEGAFSECDSLETITLGPNIDKIHTEVFSSCSALKTIFVPAKKTDYYKKRLPENLHSLIVELEPIKKQ